MSTGLNGRLARLERVLVPPEASRCRACGLAHARLPIPLEIAEAIVARDLGGRTVEVPRLCLCTGSCGPGRDIARLSHGMPVGGTRWSD